jgi:hypothetical protein
LLQQARRSHVQLNLRFFEISPITPSNVLGACGIKDFVTATYVKDGETLAIAISTINFNEVAGLQDSF